MNYSALKSMIESIINSFKCPLCKEGIKENNIDIIWAAWKTINIWIECPKCKKNSMIKVEIVWVDITNLNLDKNKIWLLQSKINKLKWNTLKYNKIINNNIKINDEHIVNLSKNLRIKNLNVNDLFKE